MNGAISVSLQLLVLCCLVSQSMGQNTWGEWAKEWSNCTATCGFCGTRSRKRVCPTPPCEGNEIGRDNACPAGKTNIACTKSSGSSCSLPYCCTGTLVQENDKFMCIRNPEIGSWDPWVDSGYCSKVCGLCGTKKQIRKCVPPGSVCDGFVGQREREFRCNNARCNSSKMDQCCAPYLPTSSNGKLICR